MSFHVIDSVMNNLLLLIFGTSSIISCYFILYLDFDSICHNLLDCLIFGYIIPIILSVIMIFITSMLFLSLFQWKYGLRYDTYSYSAKKRCDIMAVTTFDGDLDYNKQVINRLILDHFNELNGGEATEDKPLILLRNDFIIWCIKREFFGTVCQFNLDNFVTLDFAKQILKVIKNYNPHLKHSSNDISKLLKNVVEIILSHDKNQPFKINDLIELIERTSYFDNHIWDTINMIIKSNPDILQTKCPPSPWWKMMDKYVGLLPIQVYLTKNLPSYSNEFTCLCKGVDMSKLRLSKRSYRINAPTLRALVNLGFDPTLKLQDYLSEGRYLLHSVYSSETVRYLIEYYSKNNIHIDVEDKNGHTPMWNYLKYSIEVRKIIDTTDILKLFIKAGANPFHIDNYGKNFFEYTRNLEETQFVSKLYSIVSTEYYQFLAEKNKKREIIKNIDF